jgi:catechol 2,3-dioxygenase-like lactoylglutathione lyase family enzyme
LHGFEPRFSNVCFVHIARVAQATAETLRLRDSDMNFTVQRVVPILRIFDQQKAREFYIDYLGFRIDWTHQFNGQGPCYLHISRGALVLHLSQHHGDGTPGHVIYIAATGVRELHAELHASNYAFLKPGIETSPGADDGVCMTLTDPFGNSLRFDERVTTM